MKYSSALAFVVTGVAAAATAGCSSNGFGSCEATYSCAPAATAGSAGSGAHAGTSSAGAGGEAGAADSAGASAAGAAGSSGGDAGSAGDGGTAGDSAAGAGGAGAAGSAGAAGNAGAAGSAGAGGAVNGPPTLFGSCDALGAVACEEHASAQRLACDGSKWQAGTTCASGQLCDSSDGACKPVVSECAAQKPGDVVCRTGDIPLTCGPDLVTASAGNACDGVCSDGMCVAPTCGDSKLQANEECDDGNTVNSDACTASCKNAVCGDGAVWAGHETCDDKNSVAGDGCSKTCAWEPVALDAAGAGHTCALGANGVVKCWGNNANGELGLGDTLSRGDQANELGAKLPAVNLGTKHTAKQIAVGGYFSCALLDDGSVKCWGDNSAGELGLGDTDNRGDGPGEMGDALKAVDLGAGRSAKAIGAGHLHACALLDDNTVKCWGSNSVGQLGTGNINDIGDKPGQLGAALAPIKLGSNRYAKSISLGGYHSCVILDNDTLKCFGANGYGQLGIGHIDVGAGSSQMTAGDAAQIVKFGSRTVKAVAAGYSFTCAILSDDALECWGENSYGYLGVGNTTNDPDPQNVALGSGRHATSIALGRNAVCAVLDDGHVKCWGVGPLGLGDTQVRGDMPNEMGDALPEIDLGANLTAKQVTVGYSHMCALLGSGSVKCWGVNAEGELGLGNTSTLGDAVGEMGNALPAVNLVF